ncbi:PaaI family thioesterase [Pseudoruegeria sp. HB172150]|uniref:PaaI family thioesterase n=1 Tax=Pseudoruegeria sp. HB172150 TaxID=2721164 RepID=UPI0015550C47|nr:PaaI family thioesterase [Pseudoruegeria sp. HB172150]
MTHDSPQSGAGDLPGVDPAVAEEPSPMLARLGCRVTGWAEGYARVEQEIVAHIMNRYGIPHGGIYAVLLDTAMGHAGAYTGDPDRKQLTMTLSMTTNFVSRPKGTRLIAEGRRTSGGRSTYFAEAEVRDETGELCATGTGVFRYRKGAA